ncbi:hypothetical protein ACFLZI_03485 [Nitrospirota bacterium]
MADAWYSALSSDEEKQYDESVKRIQKAINQDMTFEQAVSLVDVENKKLKAAIVDDALKVLIAELHFTGGMTLEDTAKKLRLSVEIVSKARQEMLDTVEAEAIQKYKDESGGPQGNA